MKKNMIIIVLVAIIIGLVGGGWIFKTKVANFAAEKTNQAKNSLVEKALEESGLPPAIQKEILSVTKELDAKLILEFLSDPQGFVDGKTEKAQAFMKTPEGKKLKEMFEKYKKELMVD